MEEVTFAADNLLDSCYRFYVLVQYSVVVSCSPEEDICVEFLFFDWSDI